jgi:geranylgeranyl reductase family protein
VEDLEARSEVLVVGGGPAGSIAAATLAQRGIDTLLLDRKSFPRDKPCGGGISCRLLERFPEAAAHLRRSIPIHQVHQVLLESPSRHRIHVRSKEPLYLMVRRCEFDAALVDRARASGARVIEGAAAQSVEVGPSGAVVSCREGRRFGARIVIGADGVHSVVGRGSGLNPRWPENCLAVDTMEETSYDDLSVTNPDLLYVAYGYRNTLGYSYIFPKRSHVDLGAGYFLASTMRQTEDTPYEQHARFVQRCIEAGLLRGRSVRANFQGYLLPVAGPLSPSYGERVLLCGDAGGFVNGYTGEGIYYAMVSGEHAGAAAAEAVRAGDCSAARLRAYEESWSGEIGEELRQSVKIRDLLFANLGRIDTLVRLAADDATLQALLTDIPLGRIRLNDVRRRMALRLMAAALRRGMFPFRVRTLRALLGRT